MNDAILTPEDQKEEVSLLYVMAVAAKVGYNIENPRRDRGRVDLTITAGGDMSPSIKLQLKARTNLRSIDGTYRFPLDVKTYDVFRKEQLIPHYLVVFDLPTDESEWIVIADDGLTLRKRAFWMDLKGMSATENKDNITVRIPEENRFDDVILRQLMDKAREPARRDS